MVPSNIRNVIFDLGGVILDLSVESTLESFATLAGVPVTRVKELYVSHPEFLVFEKGQMTDPEFRDGLRKIFGKQVADAELDRCWNAMLGEISPARIALLKELKLRYRTFLLSNTNNIHLEFFTNSIQRTHQISSLDPLFERAYYSHQLKMRKPDAEIYLHVLQENQLVAEETLFLDDNPGNLEGAASVGIHTIQITHPDQILTIFQ